MQNQIVNTRHGKMLLNHNNDYINQQLLSRGEYEWYVVEILKHLSKGHSTGVILDIGANIGVMTLPLAAEFVNYTIHSFEIQPVLLDILKQNISINDLNNVVIHSVGLGNKVDSLEIAGPDYTKADNIGAFSINPLVWENSAMSVGTGDVISVNIVPLDSLVFDQPIRCIKLDVEGYEKMVIEGALETIKNHGYPPIVYELWSYNAWWNNEAKEIENLLNSLDYKIQKIDDTGIAIHV